jgi:hypothetical protein
MWIRTLPTALTKEKETKAVMTAGVSFCYCHFFAMQTGRVCIKATFALVLVSPLA